MGRDPQVHGRADRVAGHRPFVVLVDLRQGADDGERESRQGLRLVRQRVGLQLPARRPRREDRGDDARRRRRLMRLPRSVRDADVGGKTVLVRSDLNVPLAAGEVADDTRIRASLPTLALLLERGASAVRVCSHLGRPKTDDDRAKYSMAPVRERVAELVGDDHVHVLENTRFNPEETKNDEGFARELADGCDLYVNDAFGSAHRAHSSTVGVAALLPAYAGLLLLDDLRNLGRLLGDVEKPFVLVSG